MTHDFTLTSCAFTLVSLVGCVAGCTSGGTIPASDASTDVQTSSSVLPRPTSEDPDVQLGWSSVVKRGCPSCHQSADPTDGVLSGQTTPIADTTAYGSNLTPDPDTGMDAWNSASIVGAMRAGVDNHGQALCPAMPRYSDMTDDEGNAIATYLENLTAVHHDIPASACPSIKPMPDAGIEDAAIEDAASDATVLDAAGEPDAGPCTPTIGGFSKCSYIVNLPCGASYKENDCYLMLSDCVNLCTSGAENCHYVTGCDGGTFTASPTEPAEVECFIPTSVICGLGFPADL